MKESIPEIIKKSISMSDVLEIYGFQTNRNGRIPCPLHRGKDRNFSYNKHFFKCFVCGESGDVISFVEKLFRLPFADACKRIDRDFTLGLYREMTFEEARKARKEREKQNQIRKVEEQKQTNDRICRKILSKYHCWLWNQPKKTKEMLFDLEYTERMIKSEKTISINPYSLTTALSSKHENGGEWVDILERNRGVW